jgi:HK97 family phage prohead protease
MLKHETRNVAQKIEIREDGQTPHLVGYAAVFNSLSVDLGPFVEIVRPGAFKRALAGNPDVKALLNHNEDRMLGRTKAGTLALAEDDHGLRIEITPPDTQDGRDVVTNIRLGNYDAMSFAFEVKKQAWDMDAKPPLRELFDVDLFDVAVVTYPAYPDTEVDLRSFEAARAAAKGPVDEARRRGLEILELELGLRRVVRKA